MIRSLIGLPVRLGVRSAQFAIDGATGVVERALGIAGELADAVGQHAPDLDFDGSAHDPEPRQAERRPPPPAQAAPAGGASAAPAATVAPDAVAPPESPEAAPAVPEIEEPGHVSSEPTLVGEVAEPGAEDGAGAEVRVAEPWDGYGRMTADDVIDRVTGASAAELAAVELFELAGRRRQTVLAAVRAELERSSRRQ